MMDSELFDPAKLLEGGDRREAYQEGVSDGYLRGYMGGAFSTALLLGLFFFLL